MLKKLKQSISKLEFSEEFRNYLKKNPKAYLISGFLIMDEGDWQIDYYNPNNGLVTAFLVREKIKVKPEAQAFQEKEKKIEKLDIEKVKLDFERAMEIVEKIRQDKYGNEIPNKKIIVLQNLEDYGQVWNITFITSSFNTLNVKIDSENGMIRSENLSSVINFGQR